MNARWLGKRMQVAYSMSCVRRAICSGAGRPSRCQRTPSACEPSRRSPPRLPRAALCVAARRHGRLPHHLSIEDTATSLSVTADMAVAAGIASQCANVNLGTEAALSASARSQARGRDAVAPCVEQRRALRPLHRSRSCPAAPRLLVAAPGSCTCCFMWSAAAAALA